MRIITISGRIVADAQKQISQQGREFLTFRLANNEFSDDKDEQGNQRTYWFRVTSFNQHCINMQKYLTKGKPINVIGQYRDSLYTNKNTGAVEIARDITADRIEFELSRPMDENGNAVQNQTNAAPKVAATPKVSNEIPSVMPSTPVTQAEQTNVKDDPADDLPF